MSRENEASHTSHLFSFMMEQAYDDSAQRPSAPIVMT